MPKTDYKTARNAIQAAAGDERSLAIEMPMGVITNVLLLTLDNITQCSKDDPRLPALMEQLGFFMIPLADSYPPVVDFCRAIVFKATGIILVVG